MARRPRASAIDQAIFNAQAEIAQVRDDFGDAIAEAALAYLELSADIAFGGPVAAYRKHLRESVVAALIKFADQSPTDVEGVLRTQAAIKEYANLLEWMATTFEHGTGETLRMEAEAGEEPKDD